MQLCALDEIGHIIYAQSAQKRRDYRCLECHGIVRLREGVYRQEHFYHLRRTELCRLSSKSLPHLKAQLHIQSLAPEEMKMEYRFSEISRIADVAWPTKKLIFEIQCSPITRQEVEERNLDYKRIGYQVIWILHDQRYNQGKVSSAERFLKRKGCFFTNINALGLGIIYDQWDYIHLGRRKTKLPPLPIYIDEPIIINGSYSFKGAVNSLPKDHEYIRKIQEKMIQVSGKSPSLKERFRAIIKQLAHFLSNQFDNLLKSYCKSN